MVADENLIAMRAFLGTEIGSKLLDSYSRAGVKLSDQRQHGEDQQIPQTGEEDPLALIDDPDLKEVIAASISSRKVNRDALFAFSTTATAAESLFETDVARASECCRDGKDPVFAFSQLSKSAIKFIEEVELDASDNARCKQWLSLLVRFRAVIEQGSPTDLLQG